MGKWIPLDSTSLDRVRWNSTWSTLDLQFTSGEAYRYYEVPERIYQELLAAESPGKYFLDHIRGHYRFVRL